MRVAYYEQYGPPENLKFKDLPEPTPGSEEVVVSVKATSLNSWDYDLLLGSPFVVRLAGGGLSKPRKKVLGCDVAGIVTSVGSQVRSFRIGDKVFGDLSADRWGGLATQVCAREKTWHKIPNAVSFEQAAALPQAGVMAHQGIHDYGMAAPGKHLAINGAGGGVGTFAIQMAKTLGATITAVDHATKLDRMLELGADFVVDYTNQDFTEKPGQYDYILDVIGHHSLFDYKKALKPGGLYRMIGGNTALIAQTLFLGSLVSLLGTKKLAILAHRPNKDLASLANKVATGKITPIVDAVFPFEEIVEAFRYFGTGKHFGKIIVRMDSKL